MSRFEPGSGPHPASRAARGQRDSAGEGGAAERSEGRRAGRLRCSMLGSNQGEVLDISATGARVLLRRNPDVKAGDCFAIEIDAISGSMKIDCCVVWIRLNSERKFEMGVEFRNINEQMKKRLVETVLHPTRAETLRRGWSLIPGPIEDESMEGENQAETPR